MFSGGNQCLKHKLKPRCEWTMDHQASPAVSVCPEMHGGGTGYDAWM